MVQYRFMLRTGSQTATAELLHPIWRDDLAMEYTKESDQWFHRMGLSGSVDLIRGDYQKVMDSNLPFGTVFFMDIEKSVDGGTTWVLYWRGRFTRTDCKVNVDDGILTVKPKTVDVYTNLLNGMENEYDLIELAPEIQRILVRKRPVIQIYTMGEDTVSCVYGNQSFEQDANVSTAEDEEQFLVNKCHFAVIDSYYEVNFIDVPTALQNDFKLPFKGQIDLNVDGGTLTNNTDTYYLEYFFEYEPTRADEPDGYYRQYNGFEIYKRGEQDVKWKFEQMRIVTFIDRKKAQALSEEMTFVPVASGLALIKALKTNTGVYSRIVCSVDNLGDTSTFELSSDDIVANNRNYRRVQGYDCGNAIQQSSRTSVQPTKWGRTDNGDYFLPPDDSMDWIPIGRSRWVNTSLWFQLSNDVLNIDKQATYAYVLNDAYPLHSCISVLLAKMGSDVTFEATTDYSEFLYTKTGGVYADPIEGRDCRMFLTPKSNITAGEYQIPAKTAMVTLKTILDMLRDTYRLYWFVDAQNRLRIEHVSWFEKGGSYTAVSPVVGIDLTAMTNKRNGKAWDYGTNVYEYEKSEMPERYEFGWMDDVTLFFRGLPMEMVSPYVELGEKEEINVQNFDSDVDYMLLQPSAISLDGFALLNVEMASAIAGGQYTYNQGETGDVISVASYVWGKVCMLYMSATGDDMYIAWWYGNRKEVSQYVIHPPQDGNPFTYTYFIPDGVTGMSYESDGTTNVTLYWLRPRSDVQGTTETLQVPIVEEVRNNTIYRMQNGWLSFLNLQRPYWLYGLPASLVRMNDISQPAQARSVRRCRKSTVNIPMGDDDPNTLQLVKTGIGSGQINQVSVRLSSRMAKTELRYDTEQ